ncbi:hypothetical protein BBJ28_00001860 [Nothophytophthora sp. Chile5]|nr:hypothetical protein BBJ28_00001860 [Nothophytophthora sp. Chile5]
MGAGASTRALEELEAALHGAGDAGKLVVRHCDLRALPPELLARATHLRELTLEHAKLRQLPASFGCLVLLERLSLAGNQLETLPLSFRELQRLEELDVSANALHSLLGNFCDLIALRRLHLHSNALRKLPREFGALRSLELLDVRNNMLRKLPASFPCLTRLSRLDASRNKLKKLPAAFGNLRALRVCHLGRNALQELPELFGMATSLEVLALQHNALYKLPASFAELTNLTSLSVTGNRLESFPGDQLRSLNALVTLSYAENRLSQWQLGDRSVHLEDQDEGFQDDAEATEELSNVLGNPLSALNTVQYLDFSDNTLVTLPRRGWSQLGELLELKLARNRLERLPAGLGALRKLRRLDLAGNKLTVLPTALLSLKTLECLDVQQNTLQELPANVGECEKLDQLVLTRNRQLHGLPASLCRLSRLRELRVDRLCFLALDDDQTEFCRGLAKQIRQLEHRQPVAIPKTHEIRSTEQQADAALMASSDGHVEWRASQVGSAERWVSSTLKQ